MLVTRNQHGFSMVQAMISAAILGLISLTVMNLAQNSSKAKKGFNISEEINKHTLAIQGLLNHPAACINTVSNNPGAIRSIAADSTVTINHLRDNNGNTRYVRTDNNFSPYLMITNLELERGKFNSGAQEYPDNFLFLRVTFSKKDHVKTSSTGSVELTKRFFIHANFNSSNQATECLTHRESIIETVKEMTCIDMHGTSYDQANGTCTVDTLVDFYSSSLSTPLILDRSSQSYAETSY